MDGTPADHIIYCSLCSQETVRIGAKSSVLTISSPLRSYRLKVPDLEKYEIDIEKSEFAGFHKLLQQAGFEGLDFYCPECDRVYCEDHCQFLPTFDDDFYDYTEIICPENHRRIIDD